MHLALDENVEYSHPFFLAIPSHNPSAISPIQLRSIYLDLVAFSIAWLSCCVNAKYRFLYLAYSKPFEVLNSIYEQYYSIFCIHNVKLKL